MVKVIEVSGTLTEELLKSTWNRIERIMNFEGGRIQILISNTTTESAVADRVEERSAELYLKLRDVPNLETVAGSNIDNAGFLIFMAGEEKRITPNVSFNLRVIPYVLAAIAGESDKDPLEIDTILSKGPLDAFQFQQLGISDGYFVGNYKGFLESLVAARAST